MPQFKYVAKDDRGHTVSGVSEAASTPEVLSALRQQGLIAVSIKEELKKIRRLAAGSAGKINLTDQVIFSRQLATLVEAGIPLVQGLEILEKQMEKREFKSVIRNVQGRIEGGESLSEALSHHPRVFSHLFVNMVRAGESSGTLDAILDRLATYLEKTDSLQRKVRGALVYPGVVTAVAILITTFLIVKIIPTFAGMFSELGGELPLPTQIVMGVSNIVRHHFLLAACSLIVLGIASSLFIKTSFGRLQFDRIKLKLKVFGPLFKKVAISRFSRTLSTLVKSGVPILSSLEIVGKTSGNMVIERAIDKVREGVRQGEPVAAPLGKFAIFPPMVVRMIEVGEETGRLEEMLAKIADFYDDQVDAAVTALTSMIEPMIMVFLGVVIGGIVIAMFLPIFKMVELVGQ